MNIYDKISYEVYEESFYYIRVKVTWVMSNFSLFDKHRHELVEISYQLINKNMKSAFL